MGRSTYLAFKFDTPRGWRSLREGENVIEADDKDDALEKARISEPDAESVAVVPFGSFYMEES